MSDPFVKLQQAYPESDLGVEWGIFDGKSQLAASYRTVLGGAHVWVFGQADSTVERFLILKDENVARLFCEQVAMDRGLTVTEADPPDLDAMFKENNR